MKTSLPLYISKKTAQNVFFWTCGSHVPAVVLFILLSFNFYLLSSQVPQGFNYQAIARDNSGNPLDEATIKVRLSILTDTAEFYKTGGDPLHYIFFGPR